MLDCRNSLSGVTIYFCIVEFVSSLCLYFPRIKCGNYVHIIESNIEAHLTCILLKFQPSMCSGLLLEKLASTAVEVWENGKEVLGSASPQLLLGLATGLTSSLLLLRFSARIVRERRITWQVE